MQGTANPRTSVQFRLEPPSIFYNPLAAPVAIFRAGPNGEIGRRMGLKIPRPQGHPGSSPGSGTRVFFLGNSVLFRRRASAIRRMGLKVPCVYKSLVPSAACKAQPSNGPYTLLTRSAKESSAVVAALPPERRRQRAARSGSTLPALSVPMTRIVS